LAVKGKTNNPKGRPKGIPNKATQEFKAALNDLLEKSAPQMAKWLDDIAAEDPMKAFQVLKDFAEYIHPKLARTEIQNLDKDGEPADAKTQIDITVSAEDAYKKLLGK
jgi:hypothetical protein